MCIPILKSVQESWKNLVESIRILGIDPGSLKTGYGLIEYSGKRTIYLDSGCIKLSNKDTLANRLQTLSLELGKLIEIFNPDYGAVENEGGGKIGSEDAPQPRPKRSDGLAHFAKCCRNGRDGRRAAAGRHQAGARSSQPAPARSAAAAQSFVLDVLNQNFDIGAQVS